MHHGMYGTRVVAIAVPALFGRKLAPEIDRALPGSLPPAINLPRVLHRVLEEAF